MTVLQVQRIAPGCTVQDLGRPGLMGVGLSEGGALDRSALYEAAALLSLSSPVAGLEFTGAGGRFAVDAPLRFALTGAPMQAEIDGVPLRWNASHLLEPGQVLTLGAVQSGSYGYLTPAGGVATPVWQGSRAAHLSAGVGRMLEAGAQLPVGDDPLPEARGMWLPPADRFQGGMIRIMPGPQTGLFPKKTVMGFQTSAYRRSRQSNRQGARLDGPAVALPDAAKGLASDFILAGDIQITGDGTPVVLLAECQTVGGYPRIGTIWPADLPKFVQAPVGAMLRFQMAQGATDTPGPGLLPKLARQVQPLVRDPRDMRDLLRYEFVSGVTAGRGGT